MLIGRGDELAAFDRLLTDGAGDDRVLLVDGPTGIGKTTLLRSFIDRARDGGYTVLSAVANKLESDFAFGVVRQLFERLLHRLPIAERDALLAGPAALASSVFGMDGTAADLAATSEGMFSCLHGLYWLTADLAADRPLLIAIDD